jgi:hypothetical protein
MFGRAVAPLVVALIFTMQPAHAVIVLSGDANVTDMLVGGQGLPIDAGNQQFFTNVLQGGNNVAVLDGPESLLATWDNVNTFYNGLSGVSSTLITGTVTESHLTGADLFVAQPYDAFNSSELTVLANFITDGGSIFFIGENGAGGWPVLNGYINDALVAFGSQLRIVPDSTFGTGVETATGSQIANDPLTAGVNSFSYLVPSEVSGGTTLFFGAEAQPFVAYEGAFVPVPAAAWLFGSGLLGLIGIARRKKAA